MAQVTHGGEPISLGDPAYNVDVPQMALAPPDVPALLQEDASRDAARDLLRDAVVVPVNIDMMNSGTWFDLDDGRLWRLDIKVPGALSLEVFFEVFNLPVGGKVFIISEDGSEYVGGYTEENNRSSDRIAMDMVRGEMARLELFEPEESIGESELTLMDVGYRYRDVIGLNDPASSGLTSCQVPIGCEEGAGWAEVSESVVRIRSRVNGNLFWATGTLVDNTAHDCRPLILTSMRSSIKDGFQSSGVDYSFYRFYFSDVYGQCEAEFDFDQSISGCVSLGDSNDEGGASGSDYLLLELVNSIPESYASYYAGWRAADVTPSETVSIHHPFGVSKMIATAEEEPTVSGWGVFDTHWRVMWSTTINGRGHPDLGSTGAPLFDSDSRLIGTYTGGNGSCEGDAQPDFFGRFSSHWSANPNPPSEKLRALLDPIESGEEQLSGSAVPCEIVDHIQGYSLDRLGVYPNPTEGKLRIRAVGDEVGISSIRLYDAMGTERRVWSDDYAAILSLEGLESGLFYLTVILEDGGVLVERVIHIDR